MEDDKMKCKFCHTMIDKGVAVCYNCNSDVVYGITKQELFEVSRSSAMWFGGLSAFIIYILPEYSNMDLIVPGFGLGFYSIILVVASGLYGSHLARQNKIIEKQGSIRFFRKGRIY
ncbi:MAG: hypothetical protein DRG78_00805 [Epsilonproteobacteria bacterium]|nr:MAG: hypothetical protein DRG78_00805 [Campylobacterota bacterium]